MCTCTGAEYLKVGLRDNRLANGSLPELVFTSTILGQGNSTFALALHRESAIPSTQCDDNVLLNRTLSSGISDAGCRPCDIDPAIQPTDMQ